MKHILIVENDYDMREIYRDIFSGKSVYTIEMAENAIEAARMLKKRKYDLAILDIIMTPISGDSLYLELRADPATASLPIIIVTVLHPELLEDLEQGGNVKILQKPVSPKALFRVIDGLTGTKERKMNG